MLNDRTKLRVAKAVIAISLLLIIIWTVLRFGFKHDISNTMVLSQVFLIISMVFSIRNIQKKQKDS